MDDAQRRSEILQAEEAIRMLAEEIAKARTSASAAEDTGRNLQRAVEVVSKAGESLAESAKAQSELAGSASAAVRAAGDDSRETLSNAAGALQECLREVRELCGQLQVSSASISGQADQAAQQIGQRVDLLNSSITSLERSVWQIHAMVKPLEQKLADLASSLTATAAAVSEAKQESRRNPIEVATQIRHSLGKRMGLFSLILALSALSLGGIAIIIWLLVAGHGGF